MQLDNVETCNQRVQASQREEEEEDEDEESYKLPCCISVPLLLGPTDACDVCMHRSSHNLSQTRHICNFLNDVPVSLLHSSQCTEILLNYNSVISLCCDKNKSPKRQQHSSSPWTLHKDPYMRNWMMNSERDRCRQLRLQRLSQWQPHYTINELSFGEPSYSLAGVGCRTNRSLNILVLDSREAQPFAENLDIHLGASSNKTLSVIVDKKVCTPYVTCHSVQLLKLVVGVISLVLRTIVTIASFKG